MNSLTSFIFFVSFYLFGITTVSTLVQNCATLYSNSGFNHAKGLQVTLKEGSNYADLREEYFVDSKTGWASTGSFTIENGCQITGCNGSYFRGNCQNFGETVNNIQSIGFDTFLSASCTCQKNCTCSDIQIRKSTCAYAFLGDGCDTCGPTYVAMKGSKPNFPNVLPNKVGAIKVREGCSVTLYDAEDFEGGQTVLQGGTTTKGWTGNIKSHECSCTGRNTIFKPPRSTSYPTLIDIPQDVDGISTLINGEYKGHPGLSAALKSIKHKRSSRNAYILVLGSTGSGKSSAINVLFDNPNVTLEGVSSSTTSDIHEFRIAVPVDELGIKNSEIRVIDTPGLGDTRGLQQDAKFLATLDHYLNTHEELHNRIPNVVLIFHKFSDNRFTGEGSRFVKMLRGLSSFHRRLIDEDYSNVIFVLSHFCSSSTDVSKNPEKIIHEFKKVIEDYSVFPKPISIVVAENKAEEYDLPKVYGDFKLPNGELSPHNLLAKIDLLTSKGGDPIGQSIIHTAFNDFVYQADYPITTVTDKLIEDNNTTIAAYLTLLTNSEFNVEHTEVSQHLTTAYGTMDTRLKQKYPGSLQYLQKALNIRSIRTKSDIPKSPLEVLELLYALTKNEATLYLLDKALAIKPPAFKQYFITGEFQATTPQFQSPFQNNSISLKTSDIGYTFPSIVTFNEVNQVKDNFVTFKTPKEYLDHRRMELGMQVTDAVYPVIPNFSQWGYNILPNNIATLPVKLSAVREFRTFELVLNDNVPLSTEFTNALKGLPAFNENNLENVRIWRSFFVKYGTFVVHSVYGGGSIEIEVTANNSTMINTLSQSIFDLIDFADKVELNGRTRLDLANIDYTLRFKGGDPKFHKSNFTSMTIESVSTLLEDWRRSLTLRPVFLMTGMKLRPLGELAKTVGQNVSSQVHDVTTRLINSNLNYNPSKRVVIDLENCQKQIIESAKTASNQTTILVDEIKKMNEKIKAFELKNKADSEKAQKQIWDLEAEKIKLDINLATKTNALKERTKCEAHKMTSYKY